MEDEVDEELAEAIDEAMSPVVDQLWGPLLPVVKAELEREEAEAAAYQPTAEEIVALLRANGLKDPEEHSGPGT